MVKNPNPPNPGHEYEVIVTVVVQYFGGSLEKGNEDTIRELARLVYLNFPDGAYVKGNDGSRYRWDTSGSGEGTVVRF